MKGLKEKGGSNDKLKDYKMTEPRIRELVKEDVDDASICLELAVLDYFCKWGGRHFCWLNIL